MVRGVCTYAVAELLAEVPRDPFIPDVIWVDTGWNAALLYR